MIFALIGNQNSGKTTLFNALTGANQHVGNFPGITVAQKVGTITGTSHQVVDLPGIYSLRPYSKEEILTRDFIRKQRPDAIINIVDASNLERNLYLTLQLLTLQVPTVIAVNMMDVLLENGGDLDVDEMEKALGVPVVPISASKNRGLFQLLETLIKTAAAGTLPKRQNVYQDGPVQRCIEKVSAIVKRHKQQDTVSDLFYAVGLIEGEPEIYALLPLMPDEKARVSRYISEMERAAGMDRNSALADSRYRFIESVCGKCLVKGKENRRRRLSAGIDQILISRYLAIPLFAGIMALVLFMTFGLIGAWLSDRMADAVNGFMLLADHWLRIHEISPPLRRLVVEGVFAGVGSVLRFLPLIVTLFFFLSVLEDSGYMARVAFILDRPMRWLGLSGKSIVPMLIGFGCSVPAVMATRTLSTRRDRSLTILLLPFMSCSAKLPIYSLFAAAFFPGWEPAVMAALYLGGIFMGILAALVMKKTVLTGQRDPFVMELPDYRFPTARSTFLLMWEKAKDFMKRAFTVVFLSSVLIWFLRSFDLRLRMVENSAQSILASMGRWAAPIFTPLGFGDWRMVTALICGFTAKEAVVSTFSVILGVTTQTLPTALRQLFTPAAAASFLTFCLLYTPCVAAVAALRRELGSARKTVVVILLQCAVAWLAAFIVYRVGTYF